MPKQERGEIRAKLKAILGTCRNSTLKHLKDRDFERLQWGINKTLTDLKQLVRELLEDGLTGATKFIQNSANCMVTFARLAIKQVLIPYTNNLIERLMGEIAKRVKNKWMHWSTAGLNPTQHTSDQILQQRKLQQALAKSLKSRTHIHSHKDNVGEKLTN